MDEPTTGLHDDDIRVLARVVDRLVDRGDTVVMVEHHLGLVARADWVIDLGPEGGDAGGRVVASGRPKDIVACDRSHTGEMLRRRAQSAEAILAQ
jgi:excinuclease ABC subunit A